MTGVNCNDKNYSKSGWYDVRDGREPCEPQSTLRAMRSKRCLRSLTRKRDCFIGEVWYMKYFGMPLGMYDIVPAMCQLDYTMSEAGGAADHGAPAGT